MSTKASKYTKHENEKSYVQWRWKQIEMGARLTSEKRKRRKNVLVWLCLTFPSPVPMPMMSVD